MRNRQRGVTFIGWLFLLAPIAVVVYAGIRLAPIYLNYMKVAKAMDSAGSELKGGGDPSSIRNTIDKHFEIDMVDYPTTKDMKITRDSGGGWLVESQYDDDAPLFGNVSLHVTFDKQVKIGGGGD
jgi:Domain of unknown function (DUF4845)